MTKRTPEDLLNSHLQVSLDQVLSGFKQLGDEAPRLLAIMMSVENGDLSSAATLYADMSDILRRLGSAAQRSWTLCDVMASLLREDPDD